MVVVAIVAILASLVYPSYDSYLKAGRRTDAQRLMLEQTNLLERSYSRNGTYPEQHNITATDYYSFSYERSAVDLFTIIASPVDDSLCGELSINQQGVKTAATGHDSCWVH
ncbi:hypothetical protein A5320_20090 [Rheinheimera sp. SA_1]|nr:hypothetical protein A5320_20090 [Rheinheimera sp. SA_1]